MAQSNETDLIPGGGNSGSFGDKDCQQQFGSACHFSGSSISPTGAKICPQGQLDVIYNSAGNQFTCCCPVPLVLPVLPLSPIAPLR
jgi:hypothetical protein